MTLYCVHFRWFNDDRRLGCFVSPIRDSIREEYRSLKREMKADKDGDKEAKKKRTEDEQSHDSEEERNEILKEFHMQKVKYSEKKPTKLSKGSVLLQLKSNRFKDASN